MTSSAATPQQPGSASYIRVLRERWPVIVATALVCVAAGLITQQLLPTSYSAEADVQILPIDNSDSTFVGVDVFRNLSSDTTPNVLTLARYIQTPATATIALHNLHLKTTSTELLTHISVQPLSQTNIVAVDAKASTAKQAATLANAFADATIQRRTQDVQVGVRAVIARLQQQVSRGGGPALLPVQQRLSALRSLVGLPDPTTSVLNRADVPTAPTRVSKRLVGIATLVAGLLLGFGLALVMDMFGGTIRREEELLVRERLPILARVPRLPKKTIEDYISHAESLPPTAWEAYRTLRTNVMHGADPDQTPVILVTSAMAGEGKTLTAVNLALTLAAQDMRVILMDGDFRRPMVASIFGVVPPRDGFSATFMRGDLPAAVREVPANPNLRLLLPTLGHLSQIDRLDSERVRVAFNAARGAADVVVVDSAPASEVSDALLLAAGADITLVAVRIGYTRYDRFDALRTSLANYGVSPAGLVVTTKTPPSFVVYGSTMPVAIETRAPAQPSQWQRQDRARSRARAARAKR
ncbi:MAG TPA: hypothetical protein VGC78_13340 [Gaiellaceae bacterium]|jgi:Mrp family chromosome partitioning ATPase/capsular polysaccharide biosynthesis protein